MNRSKLLEFFDATAYPHAYHVIGCGAIGSHVCEELARLGFSNIHLYDFDTVDAHNITNQMFTHNDIGAPKVDVCAAMMKAINPDIVLYTHNTPVEPNTILNGVIILCVDNIALRKELVKTNLYNPYALAFLDFRMRLTDAQYYFAAGTELFEKQQLLATMDFTHEEAKEATPTSACGVELNVIYTVKAITAFGIANLVNWLLETDTYKTMILVNMLTYTVDAVKAQPRKRPTILPVPSTLKP